jgi:hypothetical protein
VSGNDLHSRDDTSSKLESLDEILAAAQAGRVLIQNFVPLAESLDWELGLLYWKRRGSQAFINGEVPYVINNDGVLSRQAAEIFFASLQAAEASGRLEERIFALELGVGIGLFARYFLDTFRELCLRHGRDYYRRFCYIAADSSERMLISGTRWETVCSTSAAPMRLTSRFCARSNSIHVTCALVIT